MGTHNQDFQIAVVDDSDFTRRNVVKVLEDEGFNVIGQASNAEEAMKMSVSNNAIRLFILDVVMPKSGGIDIAKFLSENGYKGYIVMMSSLTMESIIIESISNGAIDFLKKPFEPNELIKTVEKIETEFEKDN